MENGPRWKSGISWFMRYRCGAIMRPMVTREDLLRLVQSLPESALAPDDFIAIDRYVHDGPVDGRIDMEIWIKVRPRSAR